ncbi:hypothetical protein D0469_14320 [Peribacillus saganii]|uniref:Sporulation protein n=1 Tax=Peribacillus saganii TaxID=2303992 RepID=A0A372LM53_9BACI|nr:YhcN/YlaJ family sporulation lipoprotein [Peribacillus saganii]RFU67582.1 hypothetical protein D0469_14320 [Peribacillus saganii]
MREGTKIILSAILLTGLAGCAGNNDNAGDIGNRNNNGDNGVQTRNVANNGNQSRDNVRVSNKLARNVEKMNEVDDANVIVTNNDAYVAVRLKNNGNGNNNGGNGNGNDNGNPLGVRNNDGTGDGNGNGIGAGYGLGNGTNDNTDRTGGIVGANDGDVGIGDNANNLGDMNLGNNNNNGNNGNGGNGNNGGNNRDEYSRVSNAFEQKVADQIRKADRKINNVYVSTSPDVYNNMTDYADGLRGGNNNGEGLFEDFNDTVGRFFGNDNNR